MARVELRNCTVRVKDGFAGSAKVNQPSPAPANGNTTLVIDTLASLTGGGSLVPVGAGFSVIGSSRSRYTITAANNNKRFTVSLGVADGGNFKLTFNAEQTANILYNETAANVKAALVALSNVEPADMDVTGNAGGPWIVEVKGQYAGLSTPTLTIQDVNLTGAGKDPQVTTLNAGAITWKLTFTPALATADGIPADDANITFLPQQIEIKVGDGEIKYTEASEYKYDKDRGNLDTVREGDEVPMDVSMNFTFEHVKTGTSEAITPIDAIKGINSASGWFSSSSDQCEPYAVDVEIVHAPPCGSVASETILFPDFRAEKRDYDFKNATIAVSGKCNATEPMITRG